MKIVKTRKVHNCGYCGEPIPKGNKAEFYSGRAPRYKWDDEREVEEQVGIEYYNVWLHAYDCMPNETRPNYDNLQGQI